MSDSHRDLPIVLAAAADHQANAGAVVTLPQRASSGAAGYDVCAAESVLLQPTQIAAVATGLRLAIPPGYEAQVRARSGLALHHGIAVLNGPGTIDADYRGEIKVILINHGQQDFQIEPGMRIAQLVFARVEQVEFRYVEELDSSARGKGGFGSSGHTPMNQE